MSQYRPYSILHIQIADIQHQQLPVENCLCYFWWRTIPLGHIWLAPGQRSAEVFRQQMIDCVYPVLKEYISKNEIILTKPLTWYLKKLSGPALDKQLEMFLTPSLLDENSRHEGPVSVIICTRNRPEPLERCIRSIMECTDQHFELIVVDNAPSDQRTKEVVARFPNVKYVLEPSKGLDFARNAGLRNATSAIIAYTDDDVIVEKEWISKLRACFSNPLTMAVTGLVIPTSLQYKSQYLFERYWGFNKGYQPMIFDEQYFRDHVNHGVPVWDIGAGANMAFRKEVLEIAGFFDERLDVGASGCSGDSEMWYRILAEGWSCCYCPQLFVYHEHRETRKALKNQIFNYMRGQVASLFVQHETYGHIANLRRVYRQLPKYYFKRLIRAFTHGPVENDATLFTEIKGCISGWNYYRKANKESKRAEQAALKSADRIYSNNVYKPIQFSNTTN